MAGRVRRFERDESVRHQAFERARDPHGVDSSRDLRQSHTAPSGLPPTRGEATYLTLSETQKGWEKDKRSPFF